MVSNHREEDSEVGTEHAALSLQHKAGHMVGKSGSSLVMQTLKRGRGEGLQAASTFWKELGPLGSYRCLEWSQIASQCCADAGALQVLKPNSRSSLVESHKPARHLGETVLYFKSSLKS